MDSTMRFGISMEGAAMIHIGDMGNIQNGMITEAARILNRSVVSVMEHGGVWKFENKHCQEFFDVAKEMKTVNKDSAMFWSSLIHASTHNSWCRISFFEPRHEIGYLQDALEHSSREAASASDTESRLKAAARVAQKEHEAAQRHVVRLKALIEGKQ